MTTAARCLYTGPYDLVAGRDGDAGMDLPCSESVILHPGDWANIPCDFRIQLPVATFALVMGRSSTFFHKHLIVNTAVIDEGYRGDLFTCCFNMGTKPYKVEVGERLSQLILLPRANTWVDFVRVDALGKSERGSQGFGSTG